MHRGLVSDLSKGRVELNQALAVAIVVAGAPTFTMGFASWAFGLTGTPYEIVADGAFAWALTVLALTLYVALQSLVRHNRRAPRK